MRSSELVASFCVISIRFLGFYKLTRLKALNDFVKLKGHCSLLTALMKSANIPYAVVSSPGLSSLMIRPGNISVSKRTIDDVPATHASGSLKGTCSGPTLALILPDVCLAWHTSL